MCYELRCALLRLLLCVHVLCAFSLFAVSLGIGAAVFRATRWCAVRVVCCFLFRPGHELCRVMSALLRALPCCVLRPVVLPVARPGSPRSEQCFGVCFAMFILWCAVVCGLAILL